MDAMATEPMRGNRGPGLSQANSYIARFMDILMFRLNHGHLLPSGSQGDDRAVAKRPKETSSVGSLQTHRLS